MTKLNLNETVQRSHLIILLYDVCGDVTYADISYYYSKFPVITLRLSYASSVRMNTWHLWSLFCSLIPYIVYKTAYNTNYGRLQICWHRWRYMDDKGNTWMNPPVIHYDVYYILYTAKLLLWRLPHPIHLLHPLSRDCSIIFSQPPLHPLHTTHR